MPCMRPTHSLLSLLTLSLITAATTDVAYAEVFRFRGTGVLAGTPPFGVLGEELTITFDVDSELLSYSVDGPGVTHTFTPQAPIALTVEGSTSGPFTNIDPITLLRAIDGPAGTEPDKLEMTSVVGDQAALLLGLQCPGGDCLDAETSPTTPPELFNLFRSALASTSPWSADAAQFMGDDGTSNYLAEQMDWQMRSISHAASLPAVFDVRYIPEAAPAMTDGDSVILVGGFGGDFPASSTAIFEFPLDAIPSQAILTSATLRLEAQSVVGNPTLTVVAYDGDGEATEADGQAEGVEMTVGPINLLTAGELELDVETIRSLVADSSHLGIRLSSEMSGQYFAFSTLENPSALTYPTLVLEYLFEAPIGDFNADGRVDAADYTIWRNSVGSTTDLAADADGNGVIDGEDYQLWKANFGTTVTANLTAAPTAVPEPTPLLLALIFGVALLGNKSLRRPSTH